MTLPHRTVPLNATLDRLARLEYGEVDFSAHLGWPAEPGFIEPAELASHPALLLELLDLLGVHLGTEDRRVQASLFLGQYTFRVTATAVAGLVVDQRVPDLGIDCTGVSFDAHGYASRLALLRPSFWCLPTDADTAHPDAMVVADVVALKAQARAGIVGHLAPLLAALHPRARRAERLMWGTVGDSVVSAVWCLGKAIGAAEGLVALAERLVKPEPTNASAGFYHLDTPNGPYLTRNREVCCLYYRTSCEEPRQRRYCFTCPLTTNAERLRRLGDRDS